VLLIHRSSDTPIKPKDCDNEREHSFSRLFGKRESDFAAYWIVRFCQARRSFTPFEHDRFTYFCVAHEDPRLREKLREGIQDLVLSNLVKLDGLTLTLTAQFVASCYKAAPVQGLPKKKSARKKNGSGMSYIERLIEGDILF